MEIQGRPTTQGGVSGFCDPQYAGVLEAFIENFNTRGEIGASVAISIGG